MQHLLKKTMVLSIYGHVASFHVLIVHCSLYSGQFQFSAAPPTGWNQSDWGGGIFFFFLRMKWENNGRTKCGGAFKKTIKESRTCSQVAGSDWFTYNPPPQHPQKDLNLLLKSSPSSHLQSRAMNKWMKEWTDERSCAYQVPPASAPC